MRFLRMGMMVVIGGGMFASGLIAQASSGGEFATEVNAVGESNNSASSPSYFATVSGGGSGSTTAGTSTNYRASVGSLFKQYEYGTNQNVWTGAVSNDASDGRNWSAGLPQPTAFESVVVIGPHGNSPVLTAGTLAAKEVRLLTGGVLSLTGSAMLELGDGTSAGKISVEFGATLSLGGTATIRRKGGTGPRYTMEVYGNFFVNGAAEGAGVSIRGMDAGGVMLAGEGTLVLQNLALSQGASGGVLLAYVRGDLTRATGITFPDTSFLPGGVNVRASGGGTLDIANANTSTVGQGFGENYDDDAAGAVTWYVTPPPIVLEPRIEVAIGIAQTAFFTSLNIAQNVVVGQWRLSAVDGAAAFSGLSFSASGTTNEALAISRLRLFADLNSNGARESNEPMLGSPITSMSGDNTTATFSFAPQALAIGNPYRVLLVADLSGKGVAGETIQFSLSSASSVVSVAPNATTSAAPVRGSFPVLGSFVTLGITGIPLLGKMALASDTAPIAASGQVATVKVSNVGGSPMQLSAATLFATSTSGTVVEISDRSLQFSQTALAAGQEATISFTFTLPVTIGAGDWLFDASVSGLDAVLGAFLSDSNVSQTARLKVTAPLAFVNTTLLKGTVGANYTGFIEVSGGVPPFTITRDTGELPPGVTLESSGLLSGKPTQDGTFSFRVMARDVQPLSRTQQYTIVVDKAPVTNDPGNQQTGSVSILSRSLPGAVRGENYTFTLSSAPAGGSWNVKDGALPTGILLAGDGKVSGSPTAEGVFTFVLRVAVSGSGSAEQTFTLQVFSPEPVVSGPPPIAFGTPSGVNVSSGAPTGVVMDMSGANPKPASVASDASKNFIDIVSSDETGPTLSTAFYFDLNKSGTVDQGDIVRAVMSESVFIETGSLLDFSLSDGTLGSNPILSAGAKKNRLEFILGVSPTLTLGTTRIELRAGAGLMDLNGNLAQVSSAVIKDGAVAEAAVQLLSLNGEAIEVLDAVNIDWSIKPVDTAWRIALDLWKDGVLHSAIASNLSDTGRYTWNVPTGITGPGYRVRITAVNTVLDLTLSDESSQAFNIYPAGSLDSGTPPAFLAVATSSLTDGEVGLTYAASLSATGGNAPYSWLVSEGSLPAGLSLSAAGALAGTPTASGTYTVGVTVTDAGGDSSSGSVSIRVFGALNLLTGWLPPAVVSQPYSARIRVQGGAGGLTWALAAGSLPAGITRESADDAAYILSGTPTSAGRRLFVIRVTDALGAVRSRAVQLVVVDGTELVGAGRGMLVDVDRDTASVMEISGLGLAGVQRVGDLAWDASAKVVYGTDLASGMLMQFSLLTGRATPVGSIGFDDVRALANNHSSGVLFGVNTATGELISIDKTSGAGTLVGDTELGEVTGIAWDSGAGKLFAVDNATDSLYTLNTNTASATLIGALGFSNVVGIANDAATGTLYGVDGLAGRLLTIDKSSGTATAKGLLGTSGISGLTFNTVTQNLNSVSNGKLQLLRISPTTSFATPVGSFGLAASDLAYDTTRTVIYTVNTLTNELVAIGPTTGNWATVGKINSGTVRGLAYDEAKDIVYGADNFSGSLLAIDPVSGAGTSIGSIGFSSMVGLAYDRSSGRLYGVEDASDRLIRIDPDTGAGTAVGALGFSNPGGLAWDATRGVLVGSDVAMHKLLDIDESTGSAAIIGDTGFAVGGLAFDLVSGMLFGADSNLSQLLRIDGGNAGTSTIGAMGLSGLEDMCWDSSGSTLYAIDSTSGCLCRINEDTGESTAIGPLGVDGMSALALSTMSQTLYGASRSTGLLYAIDITTGAASAIGQGLGFANVEAMALHPVSATLYGVDTATDQLLLIDTNTGVATVVGTLGMDRVSALAFNPTGTILYAVDAASGKLVTVDTATGATTAIATDKRVGGLLGLAWR